MDRLHYRFALFACVCLAALATSAPAAVIRVKWDSPTNGPGDNWSNAYQTVAAAIAASAAGDEIWVAGDAAKPYVERITLKSGVGLYGGFAGNEEIRDERDWRAHETVLDGSDGGAVVRVTQAKADTTRIDGFTVRNGAASSPGGGISCSSSTIAIANNRICRNAGAGIACSSSSATITNNEITDNASGGVGCSGEGTITIVSNILARNTIAYNGGGIRCDNKCVVSIIGNTIKDNKTQDSGGGIYVNAVTFTITDNVITGNYAMYGGGISSYGYAGSTIEHNALRGNVAISGGGIYGQQYDRATIRRNDIAGNSESGVHLRSSYTSFVGNTVCGSLTDGLYCDASSPAVTNNTFAGNGRNGIYLYTSSSPSITNNIVAFNATGIGKPSSGAPVLRSNCVYGNTVRNYDYFVTPGPGDISADPKLVAWEWGKVHIQPDSPCKDAGDDAVVADDWLDIDGQPRIQGAHVDIGADESDGAVFAFTPVVVRVSPGGSDLNDGLSWEKAKRTVQAGVDAALATGGDVWVAAGVYNESIFLRPYVNLYGGFAGTETTCAARDWSANPSVLDNGRLGRMTCWSAGAIARIDGFTIRNNGSIGVLCERSNPTIANCTISGNSGGGIYIQQGAPLVHNNWIVANSGGGVYQYGGGELTNNTIVGNSGGGVYCYSGSVPTATNNIVAYNSSGFYVNSTGTPKLQSNCVFANMGRDYEGLTPGVGDISVDPRLVAWEWGRYHIQPESPCRDAGRDAAVAAGWLDVDGQPRIQGPHVDMGADESDGAVWTHALGVVRVSENGSDSNDGSSWALAKRTVQAAVTAASEFGGEVWVAAGTYRETVMLLPYVGLYGGFAGDESAREERDWRINTTILDGEATDSVVTSFAGTVAGTVDGFTIRNGKARYGGGIYCRGGIPIANNTIHENNATGYGGGVYFAGSATFSNNTVSGNHAGERGGGVHCEYASPAIADNVITGNNARYGGGISCTRSQSRITNNTVSDNTATSGGGGLYFADNSSPAVSNNIVAYNGSGIYKTSGSGSPVLKNNCVYNPGGANYSGVVAGTDDISDDPLFVDRVGGDLHLTAASPCRDSGYDSAASVGWVDIDGQSRFHKTVDIGADEFWPQEAGYAKSWADSAIVSGLNGVVTAVFGDAFYIEAPDRPAGIRVEMTGHGLIAGTAVTVSGAMATTADGERMIQASSVSGMPGALLLPLALALRSLGGDASAGYPAASGTGQQGVAGGRGLNNIGLLVKVFGRVTFVDPGGQFFTVWDGSLVKDADGHDGVRVWAPGLTLPGSGDFVTVTGISSCTKVSEDLFPQVLVRTAGDIVRVL